MLTKLKKVIFYFGIITSALMTVLFAIILIPITFSLKKSFRYSLKIAIKVFFFFLNIQIKTNNLEYLKNNTTYLFVANYQHILDTFIMIFSIPFYYKTTGQFYEKLNLKGDFFAKILNLMTMFDKPLSIDQKNWANNYLNMQKIITYLKTEGSLFMFINLKPAFSKNFQKAKKGPAFIASEANVPIIPITIHGSDAITENIGFYLQGGNKLAKKTIEVTFHKPIILSDDIIEDQVSHIDEITNVIEKTILDTYLNQEGKNVW